MQELTKFLTDKTARIFEELSKQEFLQNFTLVGGSGLAYYLKHRLSEDLDFFSPDKELPLDTENFLNYLAQTYNLKLVNITKSQVNLFLDEVKITLFAYNWEILRTGRVQILNNVYVANLDILCAMKINTLSLRAKLRDYYDLYLINKEVYDIEKMFEIAERLLPGMTKKIFTMQLTFIEDIEDENIDHLSPREKVDIVEIKKHFEREVEKILKKN